MVNCHQCHAATTKTSVGTLGLNHPNSESAGGQQTMLRTKHTSGTLTTPPLPNPPCSHTVQSGLIACAVLLEQVATSIEHIGSLAKTMPQQVNPDTCTVPEDRELPAYPTTKQFAGAPARPKKRCREDTGICQHGRRRSRCKE